MLRISIFIFSHVLLVSLIFFFIHDVKGEEIEKWINLNYKNNTYDFYMLQVECKVESPALCLRFDEIDNATIYFGEASNNCKIDVNSCLIPHTYEYSDPQGNLEGVYFQDIIYLAGGIITQSGLTMDDPLPIDKGHPLLVTWKKSHPLAWNWNSTSLSFPLNYTRH
jgi:hypothetical protein